ncbi:hypothetical protein [Terrimonas alba]|uniref:hypothetical protein n=1 Tax=Terrimonas alba TaxID=3349636 RepID=UPI0035F251C1
MKQHSVFIFLFFCLQATAQPVKDKLVGDWKFYLKDKTSFEFLRLSSDGTGIKCFGQTINGKDSLFLNHVTTLLITNWLVEKRKLSIESENAVSFKVNPEYILDLDDNNILRLEGEHLIFYLYPSHLNRSEFKRTVIYQRADKIPKDYGVKTAKCIVEDRHLFSIQQIDSTTQLATYKGFDDLIPYIVSCNNGFEYVQNYYDPPYSLTIPNSIHKWSFGFGNKEFYISFNSDDGDTSETSIVIYYDFDNELKTFFFNQLNSGKVKKNVVNLNGLTIYKTQYTQDKFEGRIFYDNQIIIMYYTKNEKIQDDLQNSLASFKYKENIN